MVLTDREIQAAIKCQHISINPVPSEIAYGSTSVDLSLGKFIRQWKRTESKGVEAPIVCPATEGYKFTEFLKEFSDLKELSDQGYVIEPNVFILGWTGENINLPVTSRLAARVEGKSSLARLGISVHMTAPTIHAGFTGQIQLEICNHGTLRVKLTTGMAVCQLILEQTLGTPDKGYAGQFLGQKM
jgi:dCTP deaminase